MVFVAYKGIQYIPNHHIFKILAVKNSQDNNPSKQNSLETIEHCASQL